jgi:hypothetical protein
MAQVFGGPLDGDTWAKPGEIKQHFFWNRLDNGLVRLVTYCWSEEDRVWKYQAVTNIPVFHEDK